MPLVDNINVLDISKAMTARSKNLRRYRVGNDQDFIDYIETVDSLTYEYPRATEEAAKNAIDLIKNQTTPENTTTNASMVEDVRNVGSYKVIVTTNTTTTKEAAVAPAPEVGGITWSRSSETVSSWPQNITMTSANPDDRIWYRISGVDKSGAWVSGEFINGGSNNVTVSLNSSTLAEGYNGWHKRVSIIAEARRTQLTGQVYVGAQSSRRFTQLAPIVTQITDAHWNPLGYSGFSSTPNVTMPFNLTINTGQPQASIYVIVSRLTSNGWETEYLPNEPSPRTITGLTSNPVPSYNNRRILQVNAAPFVLLDGIMYFGEQKMGLGRQPAKIYASN